MAPCSLPFAAAVAFSSPGGSLARRGCGCRCPAGAGDAGAERSQRGLRKRRVMSKPGSAEHAVAQAAEQRLGELLPLCLGRATPLAVCPHRGAGRRGRGRDAAAAPAARGRLAALRWGRTPQRRPLPPRSPRSSPAVPLL